MPVFVIVVVIGTVSLASSLFVGPAKVRFGVPPDEVIDTVGVAFGRNVTDAVADGFDTPDGETELTEASFV